jgi:cytidyltransferase-like protein
MQELTQIFKKQGQEFVNDLFNDYLVVTEKISGSSFSFQKDKDLTFFKGSGQQKINLIDRTLMIYYEPAINYVTRVTSLLTDIPKDWRFCFEYFVHNEPGVIKYDNLPKNNLVLTHIQIIGTNGKTVKIIEDPRVINDWANKLSVTPLLPIFKGYLNSEQKTKIKNFISIPIEDQEEVFGTTSFVSYLISILNPSLSNSLLHNDLNKPVDSIIFKFYRGGNTQAYAAKLIDPYTKMLMRNKEPGDLRRVPADINEIILLDILSFIEERGLRKNDILSSNTEERYLELISNIFNDYVSKRGNDIKNLNFEKADFVKGDEFDLNVDLINNEKTKALVKDSESLQNLYKIMLGSLRKTRNPDKTGAVLTPSVIADFNKVVNNIKEVTQEAGDGTFKTFNDYLNLKDTNESFFNQEDPEETIIHEREINFKDFISINKIIVEREVIPVIKNEVEKPKKPNLNILHCDPGTIPVNIFVGRFQPFTLGHVKVFEELHEQNGLPVVVFIVRGSKPDKEKRPFDEDIQLAMFASLKNEFPFLEAAIVISNASIDTIFNSARLTYEPMIWGYGTDRKTAYDAMINNPSYREMINVSPEFSGYEINRDDEDISASQVRYSLRIDDEETFKTLTPESIHDYYKSLQTLLNHVKEN